MFMSRSSGSCRSEHTDRQSVVDGDGGQRRQCERARGANGAHSGGGEGNNRAGAKAAAKAGARGEENTLRDDAQSELREGSRGTCLWMVSEHDDGYDRLTIYIYWKTREYRKSNTAPLQEESK